MSTDTGTVHRGGRTVSHSGARDTMIAYRGEDDDGREKTQAARQVREVENKLVKVRSYAHKILFMRLGAIAVPAVDGAFVQRHRLSSQRLLSRFQESQTYPCRLLRLVRQASWRVAASSRFASD